MYPVPTIRNTTLGLAVCLLGAIAMPSLTTGCAASKEEIRTARTSGYKTDFAIVYSQVLKVLRARYPALRENASAGTIKTSWHPIRIAHHGTSNNDGLTQQQRDAQNQTTQGANAFSSTSAQRKRYFIRFDIYVIGGKPWRVRIHGYASEWELGAVPTILSGANVPPWLKGRTDALYVELYRGLTKHAVPLKIKVTSGDPKRRKVAPPKPEDLTKFGNIPAPAARRVFFMANAAKSRDYKKLRSGMADEFTWNLGATPSAKAALITWQADARVLEKLIRVLEAGCKLETKPKERVVCPKTTDPAKPGGYTATFAVIGGVWKMTSFASGD